jgi:hypothetical protein
MLYIVEKVFSNVIRYFIITSKTNLIWERYERLKFWDNKSPSFGTPTWETQGKVTFGFSLHGEAQNIL